MNPTPSPSKNVRAGVLLPARPVERSWEQTSEQLWQQSGRNLGNHAFFSATIGSLAVRPEILTYGSPPQMIAERVDTLLVPAANWLSADVDLERLPDLIRTSARPTVLVGLGIQAALGESPRHVSRSVRRLLDAVSELANGRMALLSRGWDSAEFLERLGYPNVCVIGCPSVWLSHTNDLGRMVWAAAQQPLTRRAFVLGNPAVPEQRAWNQFAADQARRQPADTSLIVQEDWRFWAPSRTEEIGDDWAASLGQALGLDSGAEFWNLLRRCGAGFSDVTHWVEHCRGFDVAAGPRFHGAMVALQARIPGIVLWHDQRTRELAATTLAPSAALAEFDGSEEFLRDVINRFDAAAFDLRRRELAHRYVTILESYGVSVAPGLLRLVRNAVTSR